MKEIKPSLLVLMVDRDPEPSWLFPLAKEWMSEMCEMSEMSELKEMDYLMQGQ